MARLASRFSEDANDDLRAIVRESGRKFGRTQSVNYARQIRRAVRTLEEHPGLGRSRTDLGLPLHSYVVQSHVIFYLVTNGELVVARILHQRQDPDVRDFELEDPDEL